MNDDVALNVPEIGVGMLGYAFMGRAHSNAWRSLPFAIYPPPAVPRLVAVSGRNEKALRAMARRYGYARTYTDWRGLVADRDVQLLDNGGPNNLHAAPSIAAAEAGKHVFCEKPLARNAEEARAMFEAVERAGVKHGVAFNYRFVPAVRLARDLIRQGVLGRIYHFRAMYLQDWLMPHFNTPRLWRMDREQAGTGAIGDLAAHIVDLGRFLVGEITGVSAMTRTFIEERPLPDGRGMGRVDVDDAFVAAIGFENDAIGSLEGTRLAAGRKNYELFEINGEKGSLRFNLERLNELQLYLVEEDRPETEGFRSIMVTESSHPWIQHWWPPGHIIGWEHAFIHELAHFLDCIANDKSVAPDGATFQDGYRAALVCDAIVQSAQTKRQIDLTEVDDRG